MEPNNLPKYHTRPSFLDKLCKFHSTVAPKRNNIVVCCFILRKMNFYELLIAQKFDTCSSINNDNVFIQGQFKDNVFKKDG
jgi:hypothetical protein